MKKKTTKKTKIIVAIAILIIVLVGWACWSVQNNTPDELGAVTINQGTQARFESLSIGLSSVDNNSAWLSFRKDGETGSTNKQVVAGDKILVYDYKIEVKSVDKSYNFFIKSGSSHGTVKLIIDK